MNIVMTMAGLGTRMRSGEYSTPKPLIEICGKPMFCWALESIQPISDHDRLIFVALGEHDKNHNLTEILKANVDCDYELVLLPGVTEGQLCTVIAAETLMEQDEGLLVMSSDTFVVSGIRDDITDLNASSSGLISVCDLPGDRWSFARTDDSGRVVEVSEKVRISNHASTGLYYFTHTGRFLDYADNMISHNRRVGGEFYVMPIYTQYLADGHDIRLSLAKETWDMGTPDAAQQFTKRFSR